MYEGSIQELYRRQLLRQQQQGVVPQGHPGQFPAQAQGTAATYSQLRMQQQQLAMQAGSGAAGGPIGQLPPMGQMAQTGMVKDSTKNLLHQRMLQQQAILKQQMGTPTLPSPMSPQTHLLAVQPQGGAHLPGQPTLANTLNNQVRSIPRSGPVPLSALAAAAASTFQSLTAGPEPSLTAASTPTTLGFPPPGTGEPVVGVHGAGTLGDTRTKRHATAA